MKCKQIKDFPDYYVFEDGTVISKKSHNVKTIKPILNERGYPMIQFWKNNKREAMKPVHRIVAETFIPNPKNKPQVNHINGIKTDNTVQNLEWATNKENNDHALKNNLKKQKLNDKKVLFIKKSLKNKSHTASHLARMFDVSTTTIQHIKSGRLYKHVFLKE